jgi:hypothetical protein
MTNLLSCPFCGGEAEIERIGSARASSLVSCTNCGGKLESNESDWNTGSGWNERDCKVPTEVVEWLCGGDSGSSSRAIVFTYYDLMKDKRGGIGYRWHYPLDVDDFERCYLMLKKFPFINLEVMRSVNPVWSALCDHWEELTTLYLEQRAFFQNPKYDQVLESITDEQVFAFLETKQSHKKRKKKMPLVGSTDFIVAKWDYAREVLFKIEKQKFRDLMHKIRDSVKEEEKAILKDNNTIILGG